MGKDCYTSRELCWISLLFFFSKKKKKPTLVFTGSVCGYCYAARGRGVQTERARRRPGGVLLEKGALCSTGAGGRGPLLPVSCLFSPEQMARYAGRGEGGGAPRTFGSEEV